MMNTSRSIGLFFLIGLVALTAITAFSQEDPASVMTMLGPRAEGLIIARCSVCHSADLITQQRLPGARWETTIEKMKQWGAEISGQEADLLRRYLGSLSS
jgi:cytochrome c oxidase cbb3-type subunit 3